MTRLPEIANPRRKPYASDLSDAEWEVLKPRIPAPKGFGHTVEVDFWEILNAIDY
jgi:putative transposase